jgi:hypothetical protein
MCVKRRRRPSTHPDFIVYDSTLSEFVEFDIPSFEDATRLCMRLGLDWFTWVQSYDGSRLVVVMLIPDADDLGVLLRTVEEWGRQSGLEAISFELDGRRYALELQDRPVADVAA